jgi:hypothetical protein
MAAQVDLDRKPALAEWLAEDVWLASLLRDTWEAFRAGHAEAHEQTLRRFGQTAGPVGPQVKGA